ncbi:uncharacterized protein [Chelonus insularis]|uniref:uncharacterized protein n=1 Tax=Chelonus insularis TaxID=460826 RepID=UPI00158A8C11|nr:uncharacterized protein LOC118067930 [Chelonus insularis]
MNNLLNLFIILGLCWTCLFGLEKDRNNDDMICGQPKLNTRVETILRLQRSRTEKALGFTWTLYISKKDSEQKEPEDGEYDDYYDYDNFVENLLCKGFLIHPQVVITTARCMQEFSFKAQKNNSAIKSSYKFGQLDPTLLDKIEIRNGAWIPLVVRPLIYTTPPLIHEQIRYASNVTIHPNYNCSSMENNHALLFLSESFDMSKPDIGLLCLSNSEMLSLQCQEVYNTYSSEVDYGKLCRTNYNLYYKEKFMMCPKDLHYSKKYYYSGLYRYLVISSSQGKEAGSSYDSFVGNVDWVRSFLRENGVNDTLYEI